MIPHDWWIMWRLVPYLVVLLWHPLAWVPG